MIGIAHTAHVQTPLVTGLMRPSAYPHATRDIRLVETHISWIFLTGDYAYKLKKPVDLGFLDFSTLELRRHYCEEELRLNRRLVPQLYLGVVQIRGTVDAPAIDGEGMLLDYAVRMQQFDRSRELDVELEAGTLHLDDMDELAHTVATIHESAPHAAGDSNWGEFDHLMGPVNANFVAVRGADRSAEWQASIGALEDHANREGQRLSTLMSERKANGLVRECHGDLHLSNLVRLDQGIRAFDCIEFSPELRWIDVASDEAFLIMDLQVRGRDDLAFRFANDYLEITGDYESTRMLDFYLGYRSLVRAKVAALRLQDSGLSDDARADATTRLEQHVNLARRYAKHRRRGVVMMHGVSGSGKSWLAQRLLAPLEAFRVRSDVERKRLKGLDRLARTKSKADEGIYTVRASEATDQRLAELAGTIVAGGYAAIVDATHLARNRRAVIRDAANRAGVPSIIVNCHAPHDVLATRIANRRTEGRDASEADMAILAHQLETMEAVEPGECDTIIDVDTSTDIDSNRLAEKILEAFQDPGQSSLEDGARH